MSGARPRTDAFVLSLLVISVVLLACALSGAYRAFGYTLVLFIGMLMGLGFVRPGDRATWLAPIAATTVLLLAFAGMFANEHAAVLDTGDTLWGFQRGTAFLVYGVWIPAFFTMGLGFTLTFDRLAGRERPRRR
jgi:hypothetical protein